MRSLRILLFVAFWPISACISVQTSIENPEEMTKAAHAGETNDGYLAISVAVEAKNMIANIQVRFVVENIESNKAFYLDGHFAKNSGGDLKPFVFRLPAGMYDLNAISISSPPFSHRGREYEISSMKAALNGNTVPFNIKPGTILHIGAAGIDIQMGERSSGVYFSVVAGILEKDPPQEVWTPFASVLREIPASYKSNGVLQPWKI